MENLLRQIAFNVGVREDYFQRLLALAKERIEQYYAKHEYNRAWQYIDNLISGTIAKFSELRNELFPTYVLTKLGFWQDKKLFIDFEDDTNYETVVILWDDIFVALGHDLVGFFPKGEIDGVEERLIGVDQLIELNKVWESTDPERPLREIIAILRSMNLKNKK